MSTCRLAWRRADLIEVASPTFATAPMSAMRYRQKVQAGRPPQNTATAPPNRWAAASQTPEVLSEPKEMRDIPPAAIAGGGMSPSSSYFDPTIEQR